VIAVDHAQEQNHAHIKGDVPSENPNAFHRWMLSGPKLTSVIREFQESYTSEENDDACHHEQQSVVLKPFAEQATGLLLSKINCAIPFLNKVMV